MRINMLLNIKTILFCNFNRKFQKIAMW